MSSMDDGARVNELELKRYLRIIATALHAPSWCVQLARLPVDKPRSSWQWSLCDELSCLHDDTTWYRLNELNAWRPELVYDTLCARLETTEQCQPMGSGLCWPLEDMMHDGQESWLAWAVAEDDDTCQGYVFLREPSASGFTRRDAGVLKVLAEELLTPAIHREAARQICAQPDLSPRQQDVLDRLLLGMSVKEVARDLKLSPHTVTDYVRALYKRFGVTSRGELMAVVHGHRPLLIT